MLAHSGSTFRFCSRSLFLLDPKFPWLLAIFHYCMQHPACYERQWPSRRSGLTGLRIQHLRLRLVCWIGLDQKTASSRGWNIAVENPGSNQRELNDYCQSGSGTVWIYASMNHKYRLPLAYSHFQVRWSSCWQIIFWFTSQKTIARGGDYRTANMLNS